MKYVTRRIQITKFDTSVEELSDDDFSLLASPLILLGEPGAGKSATAEAIKEKWGSAVINADRIVSGAPLPELSEMMRPVIDGLDEASSIKSEPPIITVLKRLHDAGIQQFCLTCRATDWAHTQNERAVQNWFGNRPIVGHLQPLNVHEIAEIVDSFGNYKDDGEKFVNDAEKQGALDLTRNPQSLRLLLSAIAEAGGWPETKTRLFELASQNLSKEDNSIHKALKPDRPDTQAVMATAGQLFAQLLLSGCRGINIDGQDDLLFPRIAELSNNSIGKKDIEAAISTLLFRPSGVNCVEPVHRTVAEFLAAKWLSEQLRTGPLSKRRLDSAIYSEETVPTSLRGLHAWLATFDHTHTQLMVTKDPYGCLRYGDVAQYAVSDLRHLFERLQDLSTADPYFRSSDWSAQVCGGLARRELRNEIVDLIKNPEINYQLSTVILESLTGTELASLVHDDLREVIINDNFPYATRSRALDAYPDQHLNTDWSGIIQQLSCHESHNSSRLAIEIISSKATSIDGSSIGNAIVQYDKINEERSIGLMIGLDYTLFPKLNEQQLREIAGIVSAELPSGTRNRNDYQRKIQERLLSATHRLLRNNATVVAEDIWSWLNATTRDDIHSKEWHSFSVEYFKERIGLRRNIQALGFDTASSEDEQWLLNWHFGEMARGLYLNEEDVCHHLQHLLTRNDPPDNLQVRWKILVQWARAHRDFDGRAIRLARSQAQARPELQTILDQFDNAPIRDWEKEDQERKRRLHVKQQKQAIERHKRYSEIADQVRTGKHLGALSEIARTYLGHFQEFSESETPAHRTEQLVGTENLPYALEGLSAACVQGDIPPPAKAMRLRIEEGKEFLLEQICLAACAQHQALGKPLKNLSNDVLLCALTACQWGLHFGDRGIIENLEEALQNEVFADHDAKIQFIRDTVEPELLSGKDHVSGLYQITHDGRYNDVVGPLALKWLASSKEISAQSLKGLLAASLIALDQATLHSIIDRNVSANNWPTDEHRKIWLSAAFVQSFEQFQKQLTHFADEDANVLWSLCQFLTRERGREQFETSLYTNQLRFLILKFGPHFQLTEPPSSGWGSESPYDGGQRINAFITQLGLQKSTDAAAVLREVISAENLGNHRDHARHVLAEHTRTMAEISWKKASLLGVQKILFAGLPETIDDLQSVVMDELESLQQRLQDGIYSGKTSYWNDNQPHPENYCRDRIGEHLEPYLIKYGVRVHTEGTMPDGRRCDLLCTIGEIDLPIEIKGQWHGEVWNAACDQLEDNYSRNYRAEGRGVYLVIWFGDVPGKNPPGIREKGKPIDAPDMFKLLEMHSPREISPLTQLFVLDVS